MKIDLPIDLQDLKTIPEGAMGLYFHEYIHYIQDISTIYGLMNISTINYYIQSCAHYIDNLKKDFEVPLLLEDIVEKRIDDDYGLINFDLKPIYIGSSINSKTKDINEFNYKIIDHHLSNGKSIQKVLITFKHNDTDTIRELEFGGNHVCEGMAYLGEQFNYSDILPLADDYPYAVVQKLTENIYPEILNEKILLFAICDISLMTYHPGLSYVRILEYIKTAQFITDETSIDEIYEKCLNHVKGSHVDFSDLVDKVKGEINKNFNADYYNDITEWIDVLFEKVKILRRDIPSFVVDLVRFGKPRQNEFFMKVHKELGSPLVLNELGEGTIALPSSFHPTGKNFNPGIFLAISQVLRIFYQDEPRHCELIEYCEASKESDPNIIIDNNCYNSPWKKSLEANLCPVGQIWHHWALKNYSPRYASI